MIWVFICFFTSFLFCNNIVKEEFSDGAWIEAVYDNKGRLTQLLLPDNSSVQYTYDHIFPKYVIRKSPTGEVLYSHSYDEFDEQGRLLQETHITSVQYGYYPSGALAFRTCSYLHEDYAYDDIGNLILKGEKSYLYDDRAQMLSEFPDGFTAQYDQEYNCITLNGQKITPDSSQDFIFDSLGHLISDKENEYVYDDKGRRLKKGNIAYLYLGDEEIGALENGRLKELKIPGHFQKAVGIEIDSRSFIPIYDIQGTIRLLVDWKTGEVHAKNHCDAFGRGVNPHIPYAYLGKRYDQDTGLYYFGKRYYNPNIGKWLTTDPLSALQCDNLYQYVFNNPFRYIDPYGESVWSYIVGLGEIVAGGTLCVTGGLLEIGSFGFYTIGFGLQEAAGIALITDGLGRSIYAASDPSMYKDKEGNQKDGTPGWNGAQNKQSKDAKKEIERMLGRKLTKQEEQELHRFIHGRGYNYHDIVEQGYWLFYGRR